MDHTTLPNRMRYGLATLALLLVLVMLIAPAVARADSPDPAATADSTLNPRVRMSAVHWVGLLAAVLLLGVGSALALGRHSPQP